jgi:hypothetical protein
MIDRLTKELSDVLKTPNIPAPADLKIVFVQESLLQLKEQAANA